MHGLGDTDCDHQDGADERPDHRHDLHEPDEAADQQPVVQPDEGEADGQDRTDDHDHQELQPGVRDDGLCRLVAVCGDRMEQLRSVRKLAEPAVDPGEDVMSNPGRVTVAAAAPVGEAPLTAVTAPAARRARRTGRSRPARPRRRRSRATAAHRDGEATPPRPDRWLILSSLISIAFGDFVLVRTDISALALLYVVGAYAISLGVITIGGGFWLPLSGGDRAMLILTGIVSILFGIVMFAKPGDGAIVLLALIAAYELVKGGQRARRRDRLEAPLRARPEERVRKPAREAEAAGGVVALTTARRRPRRRAASFP